MDIIFEISDDSGFLGLINTDKYRSFVAENWEFDQVKERIISESNQGHLLFWGTEVPNIWQVRICDRAVAKQEIKSFQGSILVSNTALHLINYESITAAAQFEEDQLPEEHLAHLNITLKNGLYNVTVRQLLDPDKDDIDDDSISFEIVLQKSDLQKHSKINSFKDLIWSDY